MAEAMECVVAQFGADDKKLDYRVFVWEPQAGLAQDVMLKPGAVRLALRVDPVEDE